MATVYIGSARIDERGKASGGVAGDQTGKELSKQEWYKHAKGWVVLRCKDADTAAKIAECMEKACTNRLIGYDQAQRLTLYNALKSLGFDVDKLTVKVETDCSALVRVCCAFAGITVGNFTTVNEKAMLLNTGEFVQLEGAKYETSPAYLRKGDILVTKTKGHTVVVLNDGVKAEDLAFKDYSLGDRALKNGCTGDDVRDMQAQLIALGFYCGDTGADGEFGDSTEMAVIAFQNECGIEADGVVGPVTLKHLATYRPYDEGGNYLRITGNCWLRSEPVVNDRTRLYVLKKNLEGLKNVGHKDGWYHVRFVDGNLEGWVSDKYAAEVNGL